MLVCSPGEGVVAVSACMGGTRGSGVLSSTGDTQRVHKVDLQKNGKSGPY